MGFLQVDRELGQEGVVVDVGEIEVGVPVVRAGGVLGTLRKDHGEAFLVGDLPKSAVGVHPQSRPGVAVQDEHQRRAGLHVGRSVVDVLPQGAGALVIESEGLHIGTGAIVHGGALDEVQCLRIRAARQDEYAILHANREGQKAVAAIGQGVGRFKSIQRHGWVPGVGHDVPAIPAVPPRIEGEQDVAAVLEAQRIDRLREVLRPFEITDEGRIAIGDVIELPRHLLAPLAGAGREGHLVSFTLGGKAKGRSKGKEKKGKALGHAPKVGG